MTQRLRAFGAQTALVLGSGLSPLGDLLEVDFEIPYSDVEGLPAPAVAGHCGRFLAARCGGRKLLVAVGRVHLYEGWDAEDVVRGVAFLQAAGISRIILTNAAGSLNRQIRPGGWMMVSDHLNLTGKSPLTGSPHFLDLSNLYSPRLRAAFSAAAKATGLDLPEGVYAAVHGPQYETPAEIRMLGILGADVVGMSTVLEAIKAHSLGLEVAALSCITNWAAGLSGLKLNHEEVISCGHASVATLALLLDAAISGIEGR